MTEGFDIDKQSTRCSEEDNQSNDSDGSSNSQSEKSSSNDVDELDLSALRQNCSEKLLFLLLDVITANTSVTNLVKVLR